MNAQLQTYPASEFNLLINGRLVAGASTFDVINPATEELLAVCPRADLGQLNQAVAAAKAAFPAWSATPIAERRRLLLKLADALGCLHGRHRARPDAGTGQALGCRQV